MQLQENKNDLEASGIHPVGISYDSVETLKNFSDGEGIEFPLLSDTDSLTIKAYGLEDRNGYPHPGTYVVDQQQTVRAALFLNGYRDRHPVAALVDAAKGIE